MKVIVGLGNPGRQYAGTRHNVGFAVVELLAAGPGVGDFQGRFQARVAEAHEAGQKVLLVEPVTFMNLSGQTVRQVLDFYKLTADDVLVVCDDFALPPGKLRVRAQGTHGGHNGLRSVQEHLGTTAYARLRVGVGGPKDDAVDHVLGRFKPGERPVIEAAVQTAAEAALVWLREGVAACMNRFNGDPEAKKKPTKDSEKKPGEQDPPVATGGR